MSSSLAVRECSREDDLWASPLLLPPPPPLSAANQVTIPDPSREACIVQVLVLVLAVAEGPSVAPQQGERRCQGRPQGIHAPKNAVASEGLEWSTGGGCLVERLRTGWIPRAGVCLWCGCHRVQGYTVARRLEAFAFCGHFRGEEGNRLVCVESGGSNRHPGR